MSEIPSRRRQLLTVIGATLVLGTFGALGLALSHDGPRAADTASTLIAATPVSEAPPFVQRVSATGCQQSVTITSGLGAGVLVQNTGAFPLRFEPAGTTPQPEYALAPKAWTHYVFRASGTYEITGTRIGVCATSVPPHFVLTVTVP